MNIQDIVTFVKVAEAGSVNRAALHLNLTQPAATRRLQKFEASLGNGFPLFDRSVKPAVLTAHGLLVLEHARRVIRSVDELMTSGTAALNPTGTLKIGVAHGLGETVLTSPFDTLRQAFSKVKLQISSDWSVDLIEDVRTGAIQCAVGLLTDSHMIPAGLIQVPLGSEKIVIVAAASKSSPPAEKPLNLCDLASEDWFLNPPGCSCRSALARAFDRIQLPLHVAAEVLGEDLQLSLLARSGGVGLVPQRLLEHSRYRQNLRILNVVDFRLPATISLIRTDAPGRFNAVINRLAIELRAKLT